ncbi:MAG: ABC transporter permease, partial [Dongiaceae bacterium]
MNGLLTQAFITSLLVGAVTAGIPLLLAGLGEQISEKAGVLNIGIEGMMLLGAYSGFVAAYYSDSFWLGFLAGGAGGAVVALLMALLCIRLGMNQIVIGIALTIGAQGLTALLHHFQFSRTYARLSDAPRAPVPGLSDIPILGPVLFDRHPVVYLAVLLTGGLVWLYRHTYIGLNLESAGDKPGALDAAGVSVLKTRGCAVLATGLLAGIGGAYMANIGAGLFVPFMT